MKLLAMTAGLVLMALAVIYAVKDADLSIWLQLDPAEMLLLVIAVMLNVALTGLLLWRVTLVFDACPSVGPIMMLRLTAISALLNYLPLPRFGLLGRAGFLKWKHALPLRQSAYILAIILVLAVVVLGSVCLVLITMSDFQAVIRWAVCLVIVGLFGSITSWIVRLTLNRRVAYGWSWAVLRSLDLIVAAVRIWLAFRMVGQPLEFDHAVLIVSLSLFVKLSGVTPNGLGLSEWLVALTAGYLTPIEPAAAAAAAVVDRFAEVMGVSILAAISCRRFPWPEDTKSNVQS